MQATEQKQECGASRLGPVNTLSAGLCGVPRKQHPVQVRNLERHFNGPGQ